MANKNNSLKQLQYEEIESKSANGMAVLILNTLLEIASFILFIYGMALSDSHPAPTLLIVLSAFYCFLIGPFIYAGLRILQPNEALVLTFFGKYYGTLKGAGFYFVNPFAIAFNPSASARPSTAEIPQESKKGLGGAPKKVNRKLSLKTMTLNNEKQKINDEVGNPIIIGIVVIWRVVNTARAVFNVDNYTEFLSIQCDSSLRDIVRNYPYDTTDDGEKSLRGSSQEVAKKLKEEIQNRVDIAGLEIIEARITHLAYAPEIAAAMLQRQQATAIIAARQMIVEGAVSMVEMALDKLSQNNVVQLDEERKAAMVSNLLVILCGNKDAQPIVNSGSIY
jgi:regulator of protease activity HflC (stomatin/prohibitin superfamily)